MPDTFWPYELALHEAETSGAPYQPGDRVLERRDYLSGALTVTACEPHPRGGWTIRYQLGRCEGITYDRNVVRCPTSWEDAPARAHSALELLELSTDGAIHPHQYAEARRQDAERRDEQADYLRRLADWYERHVTCIDPDMACREAEGLRRLAELLLTERSAA